MCNELDNRSLKRHWSWSALTWVGNFGPAVTGLVSGTAKSAQNQMPTLDMVRKMSFEKLSFIFVFIELP